MMSGKFDRILEDCLDRMDRGETLAQILAAYPDLEASLEPLVLAAMLGRALPPPIPSYTALRLGKNDLLAEMAMMESEGAFLEPIPQVPPRKPLFDRWGESLGRLQPAYRFAVASAVVILAGGFFTLSASASEITDQVIRSFFLNFEQVGEMFWPGSDPLRGLWDGMLFRGGQTLPDQPGDLPAGYKSLQIGTDQEDGPYLPGISAEDGLVSRPTSVFNDLDDEQLDQELADEQDIIDEQVIAEDQVIDKEDEKEEKEDLKDEEQDLKEDEKEADKEEKEEEKDIKEDEKEEDKQEKEDEKAADKLDKLEDKDKDK